MSHLGCLGGWGPSTARLPSLRAGKCFAQDDSVYKDSVEQVRAIELRLG